MLKDKTNEQPPRENQRYCTTSLIVAHLPVVAVLSKASAYTNCGSPKLMSCLSLSGRTTHGPKPKKILWYCQFIRLQYILAWWTRNTFLGGQTITFLVEKEYIHSLTRSVNTCLTRNRLSIHTKKTQIKSNQKFEAISNNLLVRLRWRLAL